ncbi:hypothetical protein FB451DRAFT_1193750 [Mycena latifolia]|nr:hypothetical protein FB451DRAFT_1193750 [Mycena latifolia]
MQTHGSDTIAQIEDLCPRLANRGVVELPFAMSSISTAGGNRCALQSWVHIAICGRPVVVDQFKLRCTAVISWHFPTTPQAEITNNTRVQSDEPSDPFGQGMSYPTARVESRRRTGCNLNIWSPTACCGLQGESDEEIKCAVQRTATQSGPEYDSREETGTGGKLEGPRPTELGVVIAVQTLRKESSEREVLVGYLQGEWARSGAHLTSRLRRFKQLPHVDENQFAKPERLGFASKAVCKHGSNTCRDRAAARSLRNGTGTRLIGAVELGDSNGAVRDLRSPSRWPGRQGMLSSVGSLEVVSVVGQTAWSAMEDDFGVAGGRLLQPLPPNLSPTKFSHGGIYAWSAMEDNSDVGLWDYRTVGFFQMLQLRNNFRRQAQLVETPADREYPKASVKIACAPIYTDYTR